MCSHGHAGSSPVSRTKALQRKLKGFFHAQTNIFPHETSSALFSSQNKKAACSRPNAGENKKQRDAIIMVASRFRLSKKSQRYGRAAALRLSIRNQRRVLRPKADLWSALGFGTVGALSRCPHASVHCVHPSGGFGTLAEQGVPKGRR